MKKLPLQIGLALTTFVATNVAGINALALEEVERQGAIDATLTAQSLPSLNDLWQQVIVLQSAGDYDEAIALLDRILKLQPNSATAWFWRGMSLSQLGQYQDAADSYAQATEVDSSCVQAFYEQGNALYNLKQYEAAVGIWKQTLTLDAEPGYAQQLRVMFICGV